MKLYGKSLSNRVSRFYLRFVGLLNPFCSVKRTLSALTSWHSQPFAALSTHTFLHHQNLRLLENFSAGDRAVSAFGREADTKLYISSRRRQEHRIRHLGRNSHRWPYTRCVTSAARPPPRRPWHLRAPSCSRLPPDPCTPFEHRRSAIRKSPGPLCGCHRLSRWPHCRFGVRRRC